MFENTGVLPGSQPFGGDDVDIAAEERLHLCGKVRQIEIGGSRSEVGEEIAVTGLGVGTASCGANQGNGNGFVALGSVENGTAVGSQDCLSTGHISNRTVRGRWRWCRFAGSRGRRGRGGSREGGFNSPPNPPPPRQPASGRGFNEGGFNNPPNVHVRHLSAMPGSGFNEGGVQ